MYPQNYTSEIIGSCWQHLSACSCSVPLTCCGSLSPYDFGDCLCLEKLRSFDLLQDVTGGMECFVYFTARLEFSLVDSFGKWVCGLGFYTRHFTISMTFKRGNNEITIILESTAVTSRFILQTVCSKYKIISIIFKPRSSHMFPNKGINITTSLCQHNTFFLFDFGYYGIPF